MATNVGSTVSGVDGSTYRLAREIGRGAEGSVWSLEGEPGLVAKFRFKGLSSQDVTKISAMCRLRTDALAKVAAWPIKLLREKGSNSPTGLLMRCISGYQSIHQLYGIKSRLKLFPEAQFPFLLHTAEGFSVEVQIVSGTRFVETTSLGLARATQTIARVSAFGGKPTCKGTGRYSCTKEALNVKPKSCCALYLVRVSVVLRTQYNALVRSNSHGPSRRPCRD